MVSLTVKGMSCEYCVSSVKKALEEVDGISNVSVNLNSAEATFDNDGASNEEIQIAIKKIGFEPVN